MSLRGMICCFVARVSNGTWHPNSIAFFSMGLPTPTTHACFCILTSSEGIELLHINIHINPIDSDGPRLHTSTPHRASTPLRLYAFTVAMSLRRVMVAVKTRAEPLSVTWPHSSFELNCAAHALQALLGPTRPYIQGPTGPAYSLKDLKDLERIEVSRPV